MNALKSLICRIVSQPALIFGLVLFVCLFSLVMAFTAEIFFGLEPCRLCIIQRYPFAVGAALALAGLAGRGRFTFPLLGLLALNFLSNAGVAFFHTGVERHWWKSWDESCSLPPMKAGQSFMENILSAPMGRCDEIPWADPLLGLSMANYNVLLCLGMAALCALAAYAARMKAKRPESASAQ